MTTQSYGDYKKVNKSLYKSLLSIPKESFIVYETGKLFCHNICQITNVSGSPYYFDDDHLTITGAELLRPLFRKIVIDSAYIKNLKEQ